MTSNRASHWAIGLGVALTLATRLAFALAEPRVLIATGVIQDDAFYYLTIARNVVRGEGLTFDGQDPTNGFHPLLLGLLLPIQKWSGGDPWLPIRATSLLLCTFAVATVPLVFALTRRVAGSGAAWIATGAFSLSPQLATLGVNGLETGLALFLGLLLAWLYLRWIASEPAPSTRRALAFGALGGVALLARIDLAIWLAALGLDWLRRARANDSLGPALRACAVAAAACSIVWLPWAATSLLLTGAAFPTSGAASREIALHLGWSNLQAVFGGARGITFDPAHVPWAWRADVAAKALYVWLLEQPLLSPLRIGVDYGVFSSLSHYAPYRLFVASPTLGLGAVATAAVGLAAAARRLPPPATEKPGFAFAVSTYCGLIGVAYVFAAPSHWYFARYFALAGWLAAIAALAPAARFARSAPGGSLRSSRGVLAVTLGCLIVLLQGSLLAGFRSNRSFAEPGARGFLASWDTLGDRIPADATIGAFQAGIYSWFSGRPVRNLDGKVNVRTQRALAERRVHEYVLDSDVEFVLDQPAIARVLMLRHAPPEARERFVPLARENRRGGAVLYRVERDSKSSDATNSRTRRK